MAKLLKMKLFYRFILLIIIVLIGCEKKPDLSDHTINYDCDFVEKENTTDGLLDEIERTIMMDCYGSKLTTKNAIQSNLIGEWHLIGFGDGWFSNITQPCGYINITKDELIFEFANEEFDTTAIYKWEIEDLWLKVEPTNKHLSMNVFCNQFMYGSYSDVGVYTLDVDQYIYEKVK